MTVSINQDARLSEHFTLGELCKTSVKTADGNIPSHTQKERFLLCAWALFLMKKVFFPKICVTLHAVK